MILLKLLSKGAHSHPKKGTNAYKTALAQNTHQRLRYIWKKGSRETQDNITANQMSTSTIYTCNYKNTLKQVL